MSLRVKLMGLGAAVALLAAQPVAAGMDCCDPCGDWEIGAHALYWVPISCKFTYALSDAIGPDNNMTSNANAHTVKCDADWGFRVFGQYLCDCTFIGLSYQWIEVKNTNAFVGNNVLPIGGLIDNTRTKARGQSRFEYQNFDVKLGRYLHRACGCNFYLFGNARWVDLSHRRSVRATNLVTGATQENHSKAELQGGALGVGLGAEFDLMCDFGLFGDFNVLGVIGEQTLKNVQARGLQNDTSNLRYPSDTCVIPEADFRLGINYRWSCGCVNFVAELGYELDYFWNAFAHPTVTSFNILNSFNFATRCEDVGFSGLFFGGKFIF